MPDFPQRLSLDPDSRRALMGSTYGNTFCGVMSVPEGVIYLAPYTHAKPGVINGHAVRPGWKPTDDIQKTEYASKGAMCAGKPVPQGSICHQEGGILGHEQAMPGHEQLAIHVNTARGGSQLEFVGFAVMMSTAKEGFGATSRSQNNTLFGRANLPNDGTLPAQWVQQITAFLKQEVPEFRSCSVTPITEVARQATNIPTPPPPPR